MIHLVVETRIEAPPEVCFDLARDVRIHEQTTGRTRERVVEMSGGPMLELGDEVTFEAVHLGIRQRLTSRIVGYDRPKSFADEMQKGAFKSLRHEHRFVADNGGTRMIDEMWLTAPLGPLGWLAEQLFLRGYMRRFLAARGKELKGLAEASGTDLQSVGGTDL
jgi:ligand-binding SRPBCC domain-containing protein